MPRSVAIVSVLVLLAACVTAEKRFEQAREDEAAGRWGSAADKYIDALRRDREYPGAREGAKRAGDRAIAQWLDVAAQITAAGRWERALAEYRKTDALLDRAAEVGVVLATPADYRARRKEAYVQAAEQALAEADAHAAAQRWSDAAAAFAAVRGHPEITGIQTERARAGQLAALLPWAEAEAAASRYDEARRLLDDAARVYGETAAETAAVHAAREKIDAAAFRRWLDGAETSLEAGAFVDAHAQVAHALDVYGPDDARSAAAHALMERVLEEGTVRVATIPATRDAAATDPVADGLLDALDRRLTDGFRAEPPLFVAVMDPAAARAELARRGPVSVRRAAMLGAKLGAHKVVLVTVLEAAATSTGTIDERFAENKDGKRVRYDVYDGVALDVRCKWRLVDVFEKRVVAEGDVAMEASTRLAHAVAATGDPDDLLLTKQERTLFDAQKRAAADRAMERKIASAVAPRVVDAVHEHVQR